MCKVVVIGQFDRIKPCGFQQLPDHQRLSPAVTNKRTVCTPLQSQAFMNNETMTIGQVAARADVHLETIRYYQRLGLVAEPLRPPRGIRRYNAETVDRLRFIRRAQQLGFALDEVRSLLALEDGQSCRETRALAEKKLTVIEARLTDLRRMQRLLKSLIAECDSGKRPRACPIIATLTAD